MCVCVHVKKAIDTDNDDRWKKSQTHISAHLILKMSSCETIIKQLMYFD